MITLANKIMKFVYFGVLEIHFNVILTKSRHMAISICGDHAKFTSFEVLPNKLTVTDFIQANCTLTENIVKILWINSESINYQWSAETGRCFLEKKNSRNPLFTLKLNPCFVLVEYVPVFSNRMRLVYSFGLLLVWLVWWWLQARTFWRYRYHLLFLMYRTSSEEARL